MSLKTQLESQAGELADALKERDSLAAKLEQVQAEVEALRDENMPLRQVVIITNLAPMSKLPFTFTYYLKSFNVIRFCLRSRGFIPQVALGISAADDAAASHALSAVEQSLSLLQGKKYTNLT